MPDVAQKRRTRARLVKEQDGTCHWCPAPIVVEGKLTKKATIDHVFVRGDERRERYANDRTIITKVAACFTCNQKRGNMAYDEFLKLMRPEWRSTEGTPT